MNRSKSADTVAVILFDGECTLCSRAVQLILRHDPAARFAFAPLQSHVALRLLYEAEIDRADLPDAVVLLEQGRLSTRSTAALRIARHLTGLWPLVYLFIVVPAPIRDAIYNLIARHRYRLFGRQTTCLVPTPDTRRRFLS